MVRAVVHAFALPTARRREPVRCRTPPHGTTAGQANRPLPRRCCAPASKPLSARRRSDGSGCKPVATAVAGTNRDARPRRTTASERRLSAGSGQAADAGGPSPGPPGRAYLAVALVSFLVLLWPLGSSSVDTADLLRGTDDVMPMVRVVDWLDGRAWSDPVQRRLNPPDGVAMHWSRIADLPTAAAISLLELWYGRDRSMYLAARAVPAALGEIFVAVFFWVAHTLTPRSHSFVPLTMAGALLVPLLQFRPGRIDHHGLQLVLIALGVGFLLRCLRDRAARPAAAVAAVGVAFPQCVGSPYGDLAPEIRYWFDNVREAQSLADLFAGRPGAAVGNAMLPLAALAYVALGTARSPARLRDPQWLAVALWAAIGPLLLMWQIRNTSFAGLMAAVALLPLAAAVNDHADRIPGLAIRVALRLAIVLACAGALVVLQATLQGNDADGDAQADCDLAAALPALADPAAFGGTVQTIAAPINQGPAILLLTPHRVLAAPYHRNVEGFADNRLLFAGTEAQALATVRRRNVDVVLFCRRHVAATAYGGGPGFLNDRLGAGDPPAWLVRVAAAPGIGLYRVDLARAGDGPDRSLPR